MQLSLTKGHSGDDHLHCVARPSAVVVQPRVVVQASMVVQGSHIVGLQCFRDLLAFESSAAVTHIRVPCLFGLFLRQAVHDSTILGLELLFHEQRELFHRCCCRVRLWQHLPVATAACSWLHGGQEKKYAEEATSRMTMG